MRHGLFTRISVQARIAAVAALMASSVAPVWAIEVQRTFAVPALDRWNYVFAGFGPFPAGSEPDAPVFSPFGNPQQALFDNRDGEMIIGFDTSPLIPSGEGTTRYRVLEAVVTTVVSRDQTFRYDPTPDPEQSYFVATDSEFVADVDAGRPIEMHLVGYRAPWSLASYTETTPFAAAPPGTLPAKGAKNAFSAQYDPPGVGVIREVSNNVDGRFDNRPLAIGTSAVTPGDLVPLGTEFTFSIDLASNPDAQRYLREGLNAGRVNLAISSLSLVGQQSTITPAFWCREGDALLGAVPAKLTVRVCVGKASDYNCDGQVDLGDLLDYVSAWVPLFGTQFAGAVDTSGDGLVDLNDLLDFVATWVLEFGT